MQRLNCLMVAVAVGFLSGCEAQPAKPTASSPPAQKTIEPAGATGETPPEKPRPPETAESQSKSPDAVTVEFIDPDGLEAAIAKHKGKVVLVDCWATWCVPCIQGFPKTVKLGREHADDGLAVISLSFDDPTDEERKAKVLQFLKDQHATFENYISKLELDNGGTEAFAIEDSSLPHYKLYGRSGKLLKTFSNSDPDQAFSHETLAAAVTEALNAKE